MKNETEYKYLELTDRASGKIEKRIPIDSPEFIEDVEDVARMFGIPASQAKQMLFDGQFLTTFGYVRKLAE